MATLWHGHFDSAEGDKRALLAEDWARYIRGFVTDGIRNGGDCLRVVADGTLTLKITADSKNGEPVDGVANIQGYIFNLRPDAAGNSWSVATPSPNPVNARIDRLVLRLDRTIPNRNITPCVLQGDAGSNPVPPPLTRNDNIWEISLARWRLGPQAIGLTQSDVTDERFDESVCGLMHSVLGLDSSVWQRQFDEFMAAIKAQDDAFLAAQLVKFNNQLTTQQTEFTGLKDAYSAWFATIKQDLPKYASFDFDNPFAYPGTVTKTTGAGTNTLTETKTNANNGAVVATRVTELGAAGYLSIETLTVYDGAAVFWKRALRTASDSTFTETVEEI